MSKKNLSIGGVLVLILVCTFLSVNFVSKASASEQSSFEGLIDRIYRAYVVNWPSEYQINGSVDVNNLPPTYDPQTVTFFENEPVEEGESSPVVESDGYNRMFLYASGGFGPKYAIEVSLDGENWVDTVQYSAPVSITIIDLEIRAPFYRMKVVEAQPGATITIQGYLR